MPQKKFISVWLCLLFILLVTIFTLFCLATTIIFFYYLIIIAFAELLNITVGSIVVISAILGFMLSTSGITTLANCSWKFLDTYAPAP